MDIKREGVIDASFENKLMSLRCVEFKIIGGIPEELPAGVWWESLLIVQS